MSNRKTKEELKRELDLLYRELTARTQLFAYKENYYKAFELVFNVKTKTYDVLYVPITIKFGILYTDSIRFIRPLPEFKEKFEEFFFLTDK